MEARKPRPRGVLIVDDHPIVRQGLRCLILQEEDLYVCGEAAGAAEALKALDAPGLDVAVIDISLKGTDGLELTKSIRAQNRTLPILIVSMHDESLYAERALRAGANGYVMKQEISDKIVEAIRQVLGGEVYVSAEIEQRILSGLRSGKDDRKASPVEDLSDRELEVFRLVGQGLGTRQIAQELRLSVKTIETYRAHIKIKLNLESATELVRHAIQWVEQQDPPAPESRPAGK